VTGRWFRYCGAVAVVERRHELGIITLAEKNRQRAELRIRFRDGADL
jgi:hypothetical protein